jgi:hypothetical protein
MQPQDYSARQTYRPPARWYRRLNWLGVALGMIGLVPRGVVVLEVRGRTSGRLRRVPIVRTSRAGADYLVSLAGESQWVRNVRAADGRAVVRRGRARPVRLEEVAEPDRADVIAAYIEAGRARGGDRTAENQATSYFGIPPDADLRDIEAIAAHYPVFRITYDGERAR